MCVLAVYPQNIGENQGKRHDCMGMEYLSALQPLGKERKGPRMGGRGCLLFLAMQVALTLVGRVGRDGMLLGLLLFKKMGD